MDLFDKIMLGDLKGTPLAEKLRPTQLQDLLGQTHLTGNKGILTQLLSQEAMPSLILWGPPGTGKTTFAQIIANSKDAVFESVNAVESGAKDLKEIGERARLRRRVEGKLTILFVDEIHRFNKAQQDVLLPFVEKGDFTLIGATTENPSYELNRALLSRCRLVSFNRLSEEALLQLIDKALASVGHHSVADVFQDKAIEAILGYADGDGRKLIGSIEVLLSSLRAIKANLPVDASWVRERLGSHAPGYDKKSDYHYDVISAFIKSIRGSDPNAALFYLAYMLKAGEDPLFVARRLVILASEDVGNADPKALPLAVACFQAVELIGMPEAAINLAQAVTYLATAPKSNRSYMALQKAQQKVESAASISVPLPLRSAQTSMMKNLGYGQGYQYPHDYPQGWVSQNYFPDGVNPEPFYEPADLGYEKHIKEFLRWLKRDH